MSRKIRLLMYIILLDGREIRLWKTKGFTKWWFVIELKHKDLGFLDEDRVEDLDSAIEIIKDLIHGQIIEELRITNFCGVRIEKKLKEAFKLLNK
jgi:hypothetical protein